MHLNPFAIATLLTAITCFLLGLFIAILGRNKLHKIWALFQFCVGGWGSLVFLSTISEDQNTAYNLWRFSHLFGVYISIFFFHSTCILCDLSFPKLIKASYLYGALNNIVHAIYNGHLVFKGTKYLFNSIYYPQAKILNLSIALAPWIFLTVFSMYLLHRYSKTHTDNLGHQARWWFVTSILGYTGGCSTFLPMFGINLYPIAVFLLPIYALIQTYAIFKFQFLGLRVVIEKSIVYSSLIACLSILYLTLVVTLEKLFQFTFNYQSPKLSLFVIFIIGISVIPLRNKIQYLLDRTLFKGTNPEIAAQNEQLRREIAQSDKYKTLGTLASGIAHEIKNPLTALRTFSEYLPRKLNDKEFLKKFSRIVGKEVNRIDGMVHQLLDYGRPAPLALKRTNIHKLINETLEVFNNKFIEQRIEISKDFDKNGKLYLNVDPNQIRQALLNILLNAVESMPNGGQLFVSSSVLRKAHSAEKFVISIKDSGCGICADDLKHIFDPFFSKKDHGTGLGLAIVQGILENHGGKVRVESQAGVGTEVTLELPMEEVKKS